MKIRQGFVSNSSSSSFVIAIKESKPCEHCGRSDANILDLIEKVDDGETSVYAKGVDNVVSELSEWVEWDPEAGKLIDEIKKLGSEGWNPAYIAISYNSESLEDLLEESETLKVLRRD